MRHQSINLNRSKHHYAILESFYREYTKNEWIDTLRTLEIKGNSIEETVKEKYNKKH